MNRNDGKRHNWNDGWICEKCGKRRADYEEEKKMINTLTTLLLMCNVDNLKVKKREYYGEWYEAVIPIGSDNVAYLTIDDDAFNKLKTILEGK